MALPAAQTMAKEDEAVMKDWMENFLPVRQRTVRSETTKDTAGFFTTSCLNSVQANGTFLCGV